MMEGPGKEGVKVGEKNLLSISVIYLANLGHCKHAEL